MNLNSHVKIQLVEKQHFKYTPKTGNSVLTANVNTFDSADSDSSLSFQWPYKLLIKNKIFQFSCYQR